METTQTQTNTRAPGTRQAARPAAQPPVATKTIPTGVPTQSVARPAAAPADMAASTRQMPKGGEVDAVTRIGPGAPAATATAVGAVGGQGTSAGANGAASAQAPGQTQTATSSGTAAGAAQSPATVQSPYVARFAGTDIAGGRKPAADAAPVAGRAPAPAASRTVESRGAGAPKAEAKKPTSEPREADKGKAPEGAADAPAPTSPASDPGFQAVVKQATTVAQGQKKHAPAARKAQEAQAAAVEPQAAVLGKGQARQVDEMGAAPAPAFDGAGFKAALKKRIAELAPKNLDEADSFKEKDKLGGVKKEMGGKVDREKEKSEGPIEKKTKEAPTTSGIERKPVEPLPAADVGKAPAPIGAGRAVPKKRDAASVEAPLKDDSRSLDDQMTEANVTDEQLQKSNEPKFLEASKAKTDAQTHAENDPKGFRQQEKRTLSKAESEAVAVAQKEVQGMYSDRNKSLTQVQGEQTQAKGKDEAARAKVAADIQGIYQTTKEKVESILNALDAKVEQAFDAGAARAKQAFEDYVEAKMDAYKDARYSGLTGWGRWVKDLFMDLPEEVNRFYEQGREVYIQHMDVVLDDVIAIIGNELTAARAEVQKGKDAIGAYVAKLPLDLKSVGQEAASEVGEKFSQLEESIENKQSELIDSLAQKYQQNLEAVDERIKEMKEANKGLISKAAGFIKDVIEAIKKLGKLLDQILSKIAEVVGLILADPIGFFDNLIAGLKKGFNNFVDNIEKHLIAGLFAWLTGALGPMNIKIPNDLFSLKGIFSLVMQVLGLTWEYMRAKAVALFGEKVVAAMEKGAEIFQKLREGPAAVWEFVKEQFNDLKEMVLDQIKEMVITEVIKAGVKWLLGLLNPVAAFIKAAMAIYNIISFIFDRAAQIAAFINSLLDAIAAIAKGQIEGAATMVENALARSIPLIIGLLASLLGISGLVQKVQKVITAIRKRIDAAIMKVLVKAKSLVGHLFGKNEKGGTPTTNVGPDERTDDQKKADVHKAAMEADALLQDDELTTDDVRKRLAPIKAKYKLNRLEVVTERRTETEEVDHIEAQINPEEQTPPRTKPGRVKIKLSRPSGFRYSTKTELLARYPDEHKTTNDSRALVKSTEARRHIIPSQEVLENIVSTLNGKTMKQAKKMLAKKGITVEENNDSVQEGAKTLFRDFFNDVENLWVGNSLENSTLGDVRDFPKEWTQTKINSHIAAIKAKYLLP